MPRGGARPGAGRKPKSTQPLKPYIGADGMPLDYMLAVLRDPDVDPRRRDKMAEAAAPYLHRRLSPQPYDDVEPELPLPPQARLGKKDAALAAAQEPDPSTPMGELLARRQGQVH